MKNMTGNFFLTGLPGAGKSSLGKHLAERSGYDFIDADKFLVNKSGVDIPTIFAMEGEEGFRAREEKVIDELTQRQNIVLATGGGAVISERNRHYLRSRGYVIYLHTQPEILFERTKYDRSRPLLQVKDSLSRLKELYMVRDPLYRQIADDILEVGEQSLSQLVAQFFSQTGLK